MKNQDKREVWAKRIKQAEEFSGSNRAFCVSNGLSIPTFQYWKKKLKKGPVVVTSSPFVRVEIEKPTMQLPDPRWVAEIILHLTRGRM
jgi:hypothetical protein